MRQKYRMHNPPHPGGVLKRLAMEPQGLTVTDLARRLGVSRKHLSRVVNEHAPITADLAVRLSRAFGTTAEVWLGMQTDYDLWQAEQANPHMEIQPLPPPPKTATG